MYERLRLEGQVTPLDNPPKQRLDLIVYNEAFHVLSKTRQSDMPIRLSEIKAYIELFGAVGELEFFVRVIQGMDSAFMKIVNKDTG